MSLSKPYSEMTESEILAHNDAVVLASGSNPDRIRELAAAATTTDNSTAVASADSWESEPLVLEEAKAVLASAEFEDDNGDEYEGDLLDPRVHEILSNIETHMGDLWENNTKRDVEHMLSLVVARGHYGNPAMTLPKLTIHEALTQALDGDPLKPDCIYQMNEIFRDGINELLAMSMDDLRNKEGDEFAARNK